MEGLVKLVSNLHQAEVVMLRQRYRSRGGSEHRKREQLFNLILEGKITTSQEGKSHFYKSGSSSAFSQLKNRLKQDIYTVLMMQDGTSRHASTERQALHDCRKAIVRAELVLDRGIFEEAIPILSKAAKVAVKYEFLSEHCTIADLLRDHAILTTSDSNLNNLGKNLRQSLTSMALLEQAKSDHLTLLMPELPAKDGTDRYAALGKKKLASMRKHYIDTGVSRLGWYYHLTAVHYHVNLRNFELAKEQVNYLAVLTKKHAALNCTSNQAGVQLDRGRIALYQAEHKLAREAAQEANSLFRRDISGRLAAIEICVLAEIASGEGTLAIASVQSAISLLKNLEGPAECMKWQLYLAAANFTAQQYDQCQSILKQTKFTNREKSTWSPGWAMLQVMTLVALKKLDWLDYRLDAIKKQMARHQKKDDLGRINKRDKIITSLILSLHRNDFDTNKLNKSCQRKFSLLESNQDEYFHDPFGWEVIRFDRWLKDYSTSAISS